jgi:hypothetical protein
MKYFATGLPAYFLDDPRARSTARAVATDQSCARNHTSCRHVTRSTTTRRQLSSFCYSIRWTTRTQRTSSSSCAGTRRRTTDRQVRNKRIRPGTASCAQLPAGIHCVRLPAYRTIEFSRLLVRPHPSLNDRCRQPHRWPRRSAASLGSGRAVAAVDFSLVRTTEAVAPRPPEPRSRGSGSCHGPSSPW